MVDEVTSTSDDLSRNAGKLADNENSVTSVIQTESNETNASTDKKPKKRKEQTEEAYLQQKSQFQQLGPLINTDDWLYDEQKLQQLDKEKKIDRVRMLHACEKAYYDRNYHQCLEFVAIGEKVFETNLDDIDTEKSSNKGGKIERHILDLHYIKQRCLERLSNSSH